jgi:hypothetical protein
VESFRINWGVLAAGVKGPSKSQETPCLEQFPQIGCTAKRQAELTQEIFEI